MRSLNRNKVRTEAEAKFRKTLKATWKGKKVTTPYEVEARVARNKTARLKELRLAKEAADKKAESLHTTKKAKVLEDAGVKFIGASISRAPGVRLKGPDGETV